jgi:hypothetical protein
MSHSPDQSYEDKEKAPGPQRVALEEVSPDDVLINRFGSMGPILAKLFNSGVEARGVERVPEDQREKKNMWNKCVHLFTRLFAGLTQNRELVC